MTVATGQKVTINRRVELLLQVLTPEDRPVPDAGVGAPANGPAGRRWPKCRIQRRPPMSVALRQPSARRAARCVLQTDSGLVHCAAVQQVQAELCPCTHRSSEVIQPRRQAAPGAIRAAQHRRLAVGNLNDDFSGDQSTASRESTRRTLFKSTNRSRHCREHVLVSQPAYRARALLASAPVKDQRAIKISQPSRRITASASFCYPAAATDIGPQ